MLADAPAALSAPCAAPVTLPSGGGLTQAQAVAAWGRDRVELVTCGERHAATVDFYRARDAALRGDDDRH